MSSKIDIENISTKHNIIIKGAKMHNLKNVDVVIPRNKLIVITGLSGSGKSSLAFDTLYAEGQRRYIESLSSYARQFLGKIDKPDVEYIKGVSPAIAIEQKVNTRNPRSTVGTSTEIYDYLKLLFARIGKTYSPVSGEEVKRDTVQNVVTYINTLPKDEKVTILAPLKIRQDRTLHQQLDVLQQQGFSRIKVNSDVVRLGKHDKVSDKDDVHILIDRILVDAEDEDNTARIADSIQTAFYEGEGEMLIEIGTENPKKRSFSNQFELDGIEFEEPNLHFFSFNNPVGACKTCEGFGSVIGIDEDLVIPNKTLSIYDDAVVCWKGEKMSEWKHQLVINSTKFDFPIHRPYYELSSEQKELLWKGNQYFEGLDSFFKFLEAESYKIQYRVMLSRYRGKTTCPDCKGTKLRKDANYVKISGKSITDIVLMPVDNALTFFSELNLNDHDQQVAKRLLIEITNRLTFLQNVGLGYLTLNRGSATLSGGESQRINLATSLGSNLVGSTYILDEPSIGLHPRDTEKLISVLESLKKLGNTVVVVEHDEDIMRAADQIIDLGPEAGTLGGNLVFQGNHDDLVKGDDSLTAKYLTGKEFIPVPEKRRNWRKSIKVTGARENNLKNIEVEFPLNIMTVVTGVSGSGKSSLIKKIFYPAVQKILGGYHEIKGQFDKLDGDYTHIKQVEFIDQNPIGRSSRSNPVTYVKAYDEIRTLYCNQPLAKQRGYKPAFFSFNVDGGRCEICEGEGEVTIEMQFMADIHLKCEACNGKRFKDEILDITVEDQNISQLLEMTIDDAVAFFNSIENKSKTHEKIIEKLAPLQEVGLGYVALGQPSSTLSGGEAQRIKLATFLGKSTSEPTLFIFDEPTTGLHFHDIKKLLKAFNALIEKGHSLVIIEHNQEIIKCADWIIDMGPGAGIHGGEIIFTGTPEDLIKNDKSYTGKYLASKINQPVQV